MLSHSQIAPAMWATRDTSAKSVIFKRGLEGVSAQIIFVLGCTAWLTSLEFVISTQVAVSL